MSKALKIRSVLTLAAMLVPLDRRSEEPGVPDGALVQRETVDLSRLGSVRRRVQLERIVYASDGLLVDGYLAQPRRPRESPLPCLIFNRGGNRDFGALDDRRAVRIFGEIAARGYVVVASQYRGNGPGRQRYPADRTCEVCEQAVGGRGREEFGGAEVADVLNLIPLLESLPEADARRIGMYGWSRGGMMTYLAMKSTDRIAAAIVGAGSANPIAGLEARSEMEHVYADLVPGWEDEATRRKALRARSVMEWVDELPENTPLLLLHGTADWRVSPRQSRELATSLEQSQRPVKLILYEGGDHGLSRHRSEVYRQTVQWLDRHVRDRTVKSRE